ncbi:hypothetical protein [Bacteroides ovatus]|jgi:uncharacterized protein YjcR|uniref:hypothetical protein n=1 Tax=Bacteroides ovatus TaxID=28116 RepID=UPI00189906B2|nr:hypothetical protein [Bacteroides ovatus]MDC2619746.1 hypothetical protein [Bacteroides ovatus]
MRTSKNDKVDISALMQSVDNSEIQNTETDKIAKLIDATTQLNKCLLSVVEQLKDITSQPIELSVKQSDIDQFRLVKNGYIQEETELLKKHVAEQLAMIKAHEQCICEVCKRGEGIWLSNFWMKVLLIIWFASIGIAFLYAIGRG